MEHRFHSGNTSSIDPADGERAKIGFISEHLQSAPFELLVPNFQSESHVYALRAMIYLKWSGRYITAIGKARKELEMGLKLSPGDALLYLWKGILAIYGDENPKLFLQDNSLPPEYRQRAEVLACLIEEFNEFRVKKSDPASPEQTEFRRRFGDFQSTLIQDTYNAARGKR